MSYDLLGPLHTDTLQKIFICLISFRKNLFIYHRNLYQSHLEYSCCKRAVSVIITYYYITTINL